MYFHLLFILIISNVNNLHNLLLIFTNKNEDRPSFSP